MLGMLLENCLFLCSGSWTLDNRLLSKLNCVQGRMLRKMLGKPIEPSMTPGDYVHECNSTLKHLKCKHKFVDWDLCVLRNHFGWAGYVSRLQKLDPNRLTYKVLCFKDASWLRLVESQNNGRQLHCRRFRDWRWEQPLVRWARHRGEEDWHILAEHQGEWRSLLLEAVSWWRHNR